MDGIDLENLNRFYSEDKLRTLTYTRYDDARIWTDRVNFLGDKTEYLIYDGLSVDGKHITAHINENVIVWDKLFISNVRVLMSEKLKIDSVVLRDGDILDSNFEGHIYIFLGYREIYVTRSENVKPLFGLYKEKKLIRCEDGSYYDASGLQTKSVR